MKKLLLTLGFVLFSTTVFSASFDNLNQALRTPEKVTHLSLVKESKLKRLSPQLGLLVNLERLEIACMEYLDSLPSEIGKLLKLRELIINNGNGCAMNVSLPESIGNLTSLSVLDLYGALDSEEAGSPPRKRKALPLALSQLSNLEELDLGRNGMTTLPPQLADLKKLKRLGLDYSDIRVLPAFIGQLSHLQELSLNSNGRIKLPDTLKNLKGLKVNLGNDYLTLKEQAQLRKRFPNISFSFENDMDDESANEELVAR